MSHLKTRKPAAPGNAVELNERALNRAISEIAVASESNKGAVAEIDRLLIKLIVHDNAISFDDAMALVADRVGFDLARRIVREMKHGDDPLHLVKHYLAGGQAIIESFAFIGATGLTRPALDRMADACFAEIGRLADASLRTGGRA